MSNNSIVTDRKTFVTRGGRELSFTAIGFGSAPLGNFLRVLSEENCDETITKAWDCGMRFFDTAPLYGLSLSELRLGRILKKYNRDDYLLATKVGRVLEPGEPNEGMSEFFLNTPKMYFTYDYSYDGVMRSYEDSMNRTKLERFDILFVHDIERGAHGGKAGMEARMKELIDLGGWRALSELRDNGDVAALGLGVNEVEPCVRLMEVADPDLFLLAGRYTLLEQAPIDTLFPQCAERGVGIVLGGPYNSGVLAGRDTFNYGEIPADVAARVKELKAVCDAHNVLLPQVALQFVVAHPLVVSVIPGPQTPEETEQNVVLLNQETPAALWDELKEKKLIHPEAPTPN